MSRPCQFFNPTIASDTPPNPNIIINGDFRVNQRGKVDGESLENNKYHIDRWRAEFNTGVYEFRYFTDTAPRLGIKATTVPDLSGTLKWASLFETRIERQDLYPLLEGGDVTLSFEVNSTLAEGVGIHSATFVCLDGVTNKRMVKEFIIGASNVWEKKSVTLSIPAGYLDLDGALNEDALRIYLSGLNSSDRQSPPDVWEDGTGANSSVNSVNWASSVSNYLFFRRVKLELGPVATPFFPRPMGEELALCQRYFQKMYHQVAGVFNSSNTGSRVGFSLPVHMRANFTASNITVSGLIGGVTDVTVSSAHDGLGAYLTPEPGPYSTVHLRYSVTADLDAEL